MSEEVLDHIRPPSDIIHADPYYVSRVDGSSMVLVPEGEFLMGREEGDIFAKSHEKPQQRVYLDAYLIDAYPITNALYRKFIEAEGYGNPAYWSQDGWDWRSGKEVARPRAWDKDEWDAANQPVAGVSWYEAEAYANWSGRRLPTDAEWEKASRGTDGREYPWGNAFPTSKVANFNSKIGRSTPVGSYPNGVSPFGCHDMAGNVNNWCLDWYWEPFREYCAKAGVNLNPVLDDEVRHLLGLTLAEKCDRGGGFATSLECWEILSCTDKVAWQRSRRELWNGFRTVKDLRAERRANSHVSLDE